VLAERHRGRGLARAERRADGQGQHAVTRAVAEHLNPVEGVDWTSVIASLTDPSWALPDGRVIAELFGDGWTEVRDSVRERLEQWRRLDEEILGPHATLRLLTIGGSTGHTRHWWGQGRWTAICRAVIADAVEAGIALPAPYDDLGPSASSPISPNRIC
jgi:hypothetical protein